MTIVGIGLDATDLPRIAAAIERYGDRFLSRILTDEELAYCRRRKDPVPHVAGRFAAKEAGMKAIGTGHSQRRALARHRGVSSRRSTATAVSRRGREPLRTAGCGARPVDHHPRPDVAIAHVILVDD